jgi:hypothetical protein
MFSWLRWPGKSQPRPDPPKDTILPTKIEVADEPFGSVISQWSYDRLTENQKKSWVYSYTDSKQTGWNEYEYTKYYKKVSPEDLAAAAKQRAESKAWLEKQRAAVRAEAAEAAAWWEKEKVEDKEAKPREAGNAVKDYLSPEAETYYANFSGKERELVFSLVKYNERLPEILKKDPNENDSYATRGFLAVGEGQYSDTSINEIIKMIFGSGFAMETNRRTLGEIYEGAIRFVKMKKDLVEIERLENLYKHTKNEIDERILSQVPFKNLLPKLENIRKSKEALVKKTPVVNSPVVNSPVVNIPVVNSPVVNIPVGNRPVVNIPQVVNSPVGNRPVVNIPQVVNRRVPQRRKSAMWGGKNMRKTRNKKRQTKKRNK